MKTPRFTDSIKFVYAYANASESSKEGYLRRKFQRSAQGQREAVELEAAKPKATVRELKTAKAKM